jgi:TetR/AcrR family transcriptional regulator
MTRRTRAARPRDPAATRERLLAAAELHFVDHGYEGARVDEIAHDAGTNKRMIYAYFEDKEGLYLEVLKRCFGRAVEAVRGSGDPPAEPRERAAAIVRRYFYFLAGNPSFVRLVSWETLSYGRHAGRVLADTTGAALEHLHDVLQQGIERGVFRADLDVRKLTASVNGMCLTYFGQRDLLGALWNQDPTAPDALEAMLAHVLTLIFDGVCRTDGPAATGGPR